MKLLRKTDGSIMEKGFTLIELLVVIAIIGVLSSIVLASLTTARGKGANAAIKGNLANMRAQAELFYDANSNSSYAYSGYPGLNVSACPNSVAAAPANTVLADPNFNGMLQAAVDAYGSAGITSTRCYIAPNGTAWAVSVPLKAVENTYTNWCVDSKGNSKGRPNPLQGSSTDCTN